MSVGTIATLISATNCVTSDWTLKGLSEYKFGLVNNDRIVTEYTIMNEVFFNALIDSLGNLMIVGTNFNIEKFMRHEVFNEWFDNYTNRI